MPRDMPRTVRRPPIGTRVLGTKAPPPPTSPGHPRFTKPPLGNFQLHRLEISGGFFLLDGKLIGILGILSGTLGFLWS